MTLKEKLRTCQEGTWWVIEDTDVAHGITGTTEVGVRSDGLIRVQYLDGEIEERAGTDALFDSLEADAGCLFRLVAFVQDGRKEATA
jgi:hypothetical protein